MVCRNGGVRSGDSNRENVRQLMDIYLGISLRSLAIRVLREVHSVSLIGVHPPQHAHNRFHSDPFRMLDSKWAGVICIIARLQLSGSSRNVKVDQSEVKGLWKWEFVTEKQSRSLAKLQTNVSHPSCCWLSLRTATPTSLHFGNTTLLPGTIGTGV